MRHTKDFVFLLIITLIGSIAATFIVARADNNFADTITINEVEPIK